MEDFFKQLLKTLNCIEVKGKQNMDYLLGAIIAVENALEQLKQETEDTADG